MINDQQGSELPWPVQPPVFGQQTDHRQRRSRQQLVVGASLLVTASLLLVLALLFAGWRTTRATPHVRHALPTTHVKPAMEQLTPTRQATPTPQTALIASQVDRLLTNMVTHQQFSGSVLIALDGQMILNRGYSMADWDRQVSNTPRTKFYLGSTTKQFTAMAILILQERGKLHVDASLCTYIVHCPRAWQPVTIHELLTHTSGIPQLDDSALSNASPQAWIASYDRVSLAFTPGSRYSYCSVCYQILGYVVEQVSGEPYSVFLQRAIFDPLQMRNTGFGSNYLSLPDHAVGYASWQAQATPPGWSVTPQWTFLFGSGLLYTTVEDLYRWDQALSTNVLVSEQALNEAFTPYTTSEYAGSSYGYGWFITKAPVPGHRLIWHDGRIDGFRTYFGHYPDDRVTIIFLSNLATLDELALASALEQIVFAYT